LNPGGDEIFCTSPDQPWGPPSLLYSGYYVCLSRGLKQPGPGIDYPHPSNSEVKEKSRVTPLLCLYGLLEGELFLLHLPLLFILKTVLVFIISACFNPKGLSSREEI
jgi:hypothetical protein